MTVPQRREHLIDTAIELFAEHGYHATGIDTILAKSGVSKKTLYRHFRSKDELILAALKKYDGLFRNGFMRQVEERAETPHDRLLAIFDVAAAWFEQNNFYGCMYINAIGEYSDPDTPIRQVCREFKSLMRRYIEDLCGEMGAADPASLAEELALLLEGAIVTAQVSQQKSHAAKIAKTAATALMAQAMTSKATASADAKQ
ncbi:TetR/AcrR family transcriptional regulator [Pelagibius sp. Alg239-R121]|uniref:TetR/AcrR family transcriptional regulator n=1 Tax=Pelagibius sp. Alg239-R121 TaxID=2993448 RepID=UPI0024A65A81|nr:TetR/AcrR family transcriptional regulator [Pelagibius sp. Alg239-R121]